MEMISKLALPRVLASSFFGLCASRSSFGSAALRSPAPGVFCFCVRLSSVSNGATSLGRQGHRASPAAPATQGACTEREPRRAGGASSLVVSRVGSGVRSLQSAPKSEELRARKSRRSSEVCARGSCLNRRTMCRKPNNYKKAKDTQNRKAMFSSFRHYFSGS